jgi:HSP20 family molecular chaperone IbpA
VEKIHDGDTVISPFVAEMRALDDRIRERAFAMSCLHDAGGDLAVEDWLRAERKLFSPPDADLTEKDSTFRLNVALPVIEGKDIEVTAMPGRIVVRADSVHKHEENDGQVCFCEFGEKKFFRRFDPPESIDVDKTTAQFEEGILHVTAPKAVVEKAPAELPSSIPS